MRNRNGFEHPPSFYTLDSGLLCFFVWNYGRARKTSVKNSFDNNKAENLIQCTGGFLQKQAESTGLLKLYSFLRNSMK